MKFTFIRVKPLYFCMASIALLAACSSQQQASEANFTKAMQAYLAKRGDLCLDKTAWPIDVTEAERPAASRNAVQMPVLERLGLVSSEMASVATSIGDGKTVQQVQRYRLTKAGMQYFLARPPRQSVTGPKPAEHDLCAARLSLDKVVGWEVSDQQADGKQAVVTYTYKVDPATWTSDPETRRAFPFVDRVIQGAGIMQLREAMTLTSHGWEAKDL
jgi:hypothetical protein